MRAVKNGIWEMELKQFFKKGMFRLSKAFDDLSYEKGSILDLNCERNLTKDL